MSALLRLASCLCAAMLLASCSLADWNERLSSPQERAQALNFVAAFRAGRLATIQGEIDPGIFKQTVAEREKLLSLIPVDGAPQLITVASQTNMTPGKTTTLKSLNYEFGSGSKWAIFQVTLSTEQHGPRVAGWRLFPSSQQPTIINKFSLAGKSSLHFLWLFLMASSVVTCITGAVLAFRDRVTSNRWLWVLGSLFGFIKFNLEWTTGAFGFQPISFMLLGASGVQASPLDPWIFSFAIPIVAIIVIVRKLRSHSSETTET